MVKLIVGEKGTGKTKQLVDIVNAAVHTDAGHLVFINCGNRHIFDINHDVRLVDAETFGINTYSKLYGFVCGIISADYDISNIFIDGILKIVKEDSIDNIKGFLSGLEKVSEEFDVDFTITISMPVDNAPEFVKVYV